MSIVISSAVAGLVTALVIKVLCRVSGRLGLVDHPSDHRMHDVDTPLVGGLAMFAGIMFAILTWDAPLSVFRPLVAGGVIVLMIGVLDDLHDMPAVVRFAGQIGAMLIMVYWGGVELQSFGQLVDPEDLKLGLWSVPVTIFAGVGVMNSMNMSDGMDGLAGCLSIVVFSLLLVAGGNSISDLDSGFLFIVLAAIVAFLFFNLPAFGRGRAAVFMGDAGSLFLGFLLCWFLIGLSQGEDRAIRPVTALWILAIPLFDTVGVMLRRLLERSSPFQADRTHYHHILRDLGLATRTVLLVVVGSAAVFGVGGLAGEYFVIPESIMFYGFLAGFACYFVGSSWLVGKLRKACGVSPSP